MDRKLPAISLRRQWIRDQRGAALIHVGIAIFVLVGMSAFVLDFGVVWLSRRQAQNAADAGALAGVIARIFDETGNTVTVDGTAERAAEQSATVNEVFGVAPVAVATFSDASVATDPVCPPYDLGGKCVRVDVYRDGTNASEELPTFFANLFGIDTQRVRATATAKVRSANGTTCLKPWIVPDRFSGPHWPDGVFDPAVDTYNRQTTGYKYPADAGALVRLHKDENDTPSFYFNMVLGGPGGDEVRDAIAGCSGVAYTVGQAITVEPGMAVGPNNQGTNDLVAKDPTALWDEANKRIVPGTSCAPGICPDGNYYEQSPRIVPVALFSPAEYDELGRPSGRFDLHIVAFLSFFVMPPGPQARIDGYLAGLVGELLAGPPVNDPGAFLQVPVLVR